MILFWIQIRSAFQIGNSFLNASRSQIKFPSICQRTNVFGEILECFSVFSNCFFIFTLLLQHGTEQSMQIRVSRIQKCQTAKNCLGIIQTSL